MTLALRVNAAAGLAEALSDQARDVRFAAVLATTRTAQAVQRAEIAEMQRVFDRPTRWTLRGTYLKPATKADPEAEVRLKDDIALAGAPAAAFLPAQIEGGPRRHKRFERSLQYVGLLPAGMYAVPGRGAQLDGYGNMNRGQIVKILSDLRATSDPTQHRSDVKKGRGKRKNERYKVIPAGRRMPAGVYLQGATTKQQRLVIAYVKAPAYRKRLDWYGVAERTIDEEFPRQFEAALERALGLPQTALLVA